MTQIGKEAAAGSDMRAFRVVVALLGVVAAGALFFAGFMTGAAPAASDLSRVSRFENCLDQAKAEFPRSVVSSHNRGVRTAVELLAWQADCARIWGLASLDPGELVRLSGFSLKPPPPRKARIGQ